MKVQGFREEEEEEEESFAVLFESVNFHSPPARLPTPPLRLPRWSRDVRVTCSLVPAPAHVCVCGSEVACVRARPQAMKKFPAPVSAR